MTQMIVVAICTAQRPNMLHACLESILAQTNLGETQLAISIVENQTNSTLLPETISLLETSGVSYNHKLEPKRGIPIARNTVLRQALLLEPDWIALIDDDERARPDWLSKLLNACDMHSANVGNGPVHRIYEKPAPHWWKSQRLKGRETGTIITEAPTNNILMDARLVRDDGLGLRFDERLTFGAEDIDFFRRAHAGGSKMIWVNDAWVEEDIPATRVEPKRLLSRMEMAAMSGTYNMILREGFWRTFAKSVPRALRRILAGAFAVSIGLILKPIWLQRGEKLYYYGIIRLKKGVGNLRAFYSSLHTYYDQIDGH